MRWGQARQKDDNNKNHRANSRLAGPGIKPDLTSLQEKPCIRQKRKVPFWGIRLVHYPDTLATRSSIRRFAWLKSVPLCFAFPSMMNDGKRRNPYRTDLRKPSREAASIT